MKRRDVVREIAEIIDPVWFGDTVWCNSWKRERHVLDNYPGQYEANQIKASERAREIVAYLERRGVVAFDEEESE